MQILQCDQDGPRDRKNGLNEVDNEQSSLPLCVAAEVLPQQLLDAERRGYRRRLSAQVADQLGQHPTDHLGIPRKRRGANYGEPETGCPAGDFAEQSGFSEACLASHQQQLARPRAGCGKPSTGQLEQVFSADQARTDLTGVSAQHNGVDGGPAVTNLRDHHRRVGREIGRETAFVGAMTDVRSALGG